MRVDVHSDLEAERSVLGAVLLAGVGALDRVVDAKLRPEHFYHGGNAAVLRAMLALDQAGSPIDPVTVRDQLDRAGELALAGGPAAVDGLAASVPSVGSLPKYCEIVRTKARWRDRQGPAHRLRDAIETEDEQAYGEAVAQAYGVEADDERETDAVEEFLAWAEGRTRSGWRTPFPKLTAALGGGLVPGDITVISGWPNMGKSPLADEFLREPAAEDGNCHLLINEMQLARRTGRMVAATSGVSWLKIEQSATDKYALTSEEWKRVLDAVQRLPVKYCRTEGWQVEDYVRYLRRHSPDMAVIDSASRIPHRDTKDLERVLGMLADAARYTDCHLILVPQLNLERHKSAIKPSPTARDLLGGGAWWRDARNILFVHRRQEMVGEKAVPMKDGHVDCDKATHGDVSKGFVPVEFDVHSMSFREMGRRSTPAPATGNGYLPDEAQF